MSDSDSDDGLLSTTVFKRPSRAETKAKKKTAQVLDEVLESSGACVEVACRVSTLKKEVPLQSADLDSADPQTLDETFSHHQKSTQKRKRDPLRQGFFEVSSDVELDETPAGKKWRKTMLTNLRDEGTSLIGVRHTISFDPKRGRGLAKFFFSKKEAVEELEQILDKLEDGETGDASFRDAVQPLRRAMDAGVLSEFLSSKRLLNLLDKHNCKDRQIVAHWLLGVVQSAGLVDCYSLVRGSMTTLLGLMQEKKLKKSAFLSTMEDFRFTLEFWVDPWSDQRQQPLSDDESAKDRNLHGLVNILTIWLEAIPLHNPPRLDLENWGKSLAALTRIGMDASGTSTSQSLNIIPNVRMLCSALCALVATRVNDPNELTTWIQMAASEICRGLGKLGHGLPNSEDATDASGWLYYATVARRMPSDSRTACELKVAIALRTLEAMHGSSVQVDHASLFSGGKNQDLLELSKRSAWVKALLQGYTSLSKLELGEDESDFPRCYAIAVCSLVAIQTAFELLKDQERGREPTKAGVFGSPENAAHVCRVLSLLGKEIDRLDSISNRMAGDSHMRRFTYLLNLFNQFRRITMTQLEKFDPGAKRDVVQKDMKHFLSGIKSSPPKC